MGQLRVVVTRHPRATGEVRRLEALVDTGAGYTAAAAVSGSDPPENASLLVRPSSR